jgi:hypothetical protein
MNDSAREKWLKVKQALEASGKTDSLYYKFAIDALAKGGKRINESELGRDQYNV